MSMLELAEYLRTFFEGIEKDEELLIEASELLRCFVQKYEPVTATSVAIYQVDELESSGDEPDEQIVARAPRTPRRSRRLPVATTPQQVAPPSPQAPSRKHHRANRAEDSPPLPTKLPRKRALTTNSTTVQSSMELKTYPALKGEGTIPWHTLVLKLTTLEDRHGQVCTMDRANQSIAIFQAIFSLEGLQQLGKCIANNLLPEPVKLAVETSKDQADAMVGKGPTLYQECCKALEAVQYYSGNVAKYDYVRKVYACHFYCRYADLLRSAELDQLRSELDVPPERGVGKESLVTRALVQAQWGPTAHNQPYYTNKIHNLKEAGKRWAMLKRAFGQVALVMVPPGYDEAVLRRIPLNHLTVIIEWIQEGVEGVSEFMAGAQRHEEEEVPLDLSSKLARLQIEAALPTGKTPNMLVDLLN